MISRISSGSNIDFSAMQQKMQDGMQKLQKSDPKLAQSLTSFNKTIESDIKSGKDPSSDMKSFMSGLSSTQKSEMKSAFGAPPSGANPLEGGASQNSQIQQLLSSSKSSSNSTDISSLLDALSSSSKSSKSNDSSSNSMQAFMKQLASTYGQGSGIDASSVLGSQGVAA